MSIHEIIWDGEMEQYIGGQMERLFAAERRSWNTSGQGLIEYALIVLLVSLVVIVVLSLVGGEINQVFENILNGLSS
jgi:pilus assembly protein Flp/PilA